MKKKSNKTLNKIKLAEWSEAVKDNAKHLCEVCGSEKNLNSHHVISRHILKTRLDERNGVCLCAKHHVMCKFYSPHKGSLGFITWFRIKRKSDYEYLLTTLPHNNFIHGFPGYNKKGE